MKNGSGEFTGSKIKANPDKPENRIHQIATLGMYSGHKTSRSACWKFLCGLRSQLRRHTPTIFIAIPSDRHGDILWHLSVQVWPFHHPVKSMRAGSGLLTIQGGDVRSRFHRFLSAPTMLNQYKGPTSLISIYTLLLKSVGRFPSSFSVYDSQERSCSIFSGRKRMGMREKTRENASPG